MLQIIKRFALLACMSLCVVMIIAAPAAKASDSIDDLLSPFYEANAAACGGIAGDTVARFIQILGRQESGSETGDPTAQNPGSTASGRYQYLDTTWQGQNFYSPALQYSRAKDAPVEVQDAVAYIEFSSYYFQIQKTGVSDTNQIVFDMGIIHYGGMGVFNNPSEWDTVPNGNTLSYREYGNNTVSHFNDASYGSKVVLHYTSAPDFESKYADKIGRPYAGSGAGCSAGSPAGSFVFYDQSDSRWGDTKIYDGNYCDPAHTIPDNIACAGCGPTSAAMVIATLKDSSVTPDMVGAFMTSLGSGVGYTSEGATADGLRQAVEHWGLNVVQVNNMDAAIQLIKSGGLVIAGGAGNHPFSDRGHVVVLRGIDVSGNMLVGNPSLFLNDNDKNKSYPIDTIIKGVKFMIGVTQ